MKIPSITLVGAGPGDPDLITLKGLKALREADVVLYDQLIDESLLEFCKPDAEKIYVGKVGHRQSINQDSINCLLVEKAYEKGSVVRLKGGDPFIFGRGLEEIIYAENRGVRASYIPGISSIQALGFHNIPLTHRGVSDGFWVITGHKADLSLTEDLKRAASSNSTVLVLMGMAKLPEIQQVFEENGKQHLPVKIIQNACTSKEKSIHTTIKNLCKDASKYSLKNPAVILLGEVVDVYAKSVPAVIEKKQIPAWRS